MAKTGFIPKVRRRVPVALAALAALSGCPNLIHVTQPVPPAPGDQPDPSGSYFTHSIQLTWSGSDLSDLGSLAITHPGGIQVTTDSSVADLTLMLPIDVQKDGHDQLARDYEAQVHRLSTFTGSDPKLVFPAHDCQERGGRLAGVCVRDLTLLVPASKLITLELSWQRHLEVDNVAFAQLKLHVPASGDGTIAHVAAQLTLDGGGPQASLVFNTLMPQAAASSTSDFLARLDSIHLTMTQVRGSVLLFLAHPELSQVVDDGTTITQFPYQRGAQPRPRP